MATWPAYAKILLEGFNERPDYGVLRTDMDNGIAKQRPRRSLPIVTRDVTVLVLSAEDKQQFDAWFRDDLYGGTGWFSWTDPVDGVTKQGRFVGGQLTWASPGKVWKAQVQIETLG